MNSQNSNPINVAFQLNTVTLRDWVALSLFQGFTKGTISGRSPTESEINAYVKDAYHFADNFLAVRETVIDKAA